VFVCQSVDSQFRDLEKQQLRGLEFKGGCWVRVHESHAKIRSAFVEISAIQTLPTDGESAPMLRLFSDRGLNWFVAQLLLSDDSRLVGLRYEGGGRVTTRAKTAAGTGAIPRGTEIESVAQSGTDVFFGFDDSWALSRFSTSDWAFTEDVDSSPISIRALANMDDKRIEAMTYLPSQKALLVFAEKLSAEPWIDSGVSSRAAWLIPVDNPSAISELGLRMKDRFDPKAADTLSNGDVLVLSCCHRKKGRSEHVNEVRIQRIESKAVRAGALLDGVRLANLKSEDTLLRKPDGTSSRPYPKLDAFEGLATFRFGGSEFVLIVSDDGRKIHRRTLLLLFELTH